MVWYGMVWYGMVWYGTFNLHRYKQHTPLSTGPLILIRTKHTTLYSDCMYSRLAEDELSGSNHVEDIKY